MSERHIFVDSLGNVVKGRENMRQGRKGYFAWFPDYTISISEVFKNGLSFALFGSAQGTYCANGSLLKKNMWKVPAAWRAVVKDRQISEWRVFADNYKTASLMKGSRETC